MGEPAPDRHLGNTAANDHTAKPSTQHDPSADIERAIAKSQGSPQELAAFIQANPQLADDVIRTLHERFGNAFVQEVLAANGTPQYGSIPMARVEGGFVMRATGIAKLDHMLADFIASDSTLSAAMVRVDFAMLTLGPENKFTVSKKAGEIQRNTNGETEHLAQDMDVRGDITGLLRSFLENLNFQMTSADGLLTGSEMQLRAAKDRKRATALLRKVATQRSRVEGVRTLITKTFELGATLLEAEVNPLELIGPLFEAVTTLISLSRDVQGDDTDDGKHADALENHAEDESIATAEYLFATYQRSIAQLRPEIEQTKSDLARQFTKFQIDRDAAEQSYDRSTGGKFKFAPMAQTADSYTSILADLELIFRTSKTQKGNVAELAALVGYAERRIAHDLGMAAAAPAMHATRSTLAQYPIALEAIAAEFGQIRERVKAPAARSAHERAEADQAMVDTRAAHVRRKP